MAQYKGFVLYGKLEMADREPPKPKGGGSSVSESSGGGAETAEPVWEYVAGEPGQCNIIVAAHVCPEKVYKDTGVSKYDDEHYMVPPNVPVFSTTKAMESMQNGNGKRSRTGVSEGLPIVAHVDPSLDKNFFGSGSDNQFVCVGVSVGSTMAGKDGPANGRCISIAVSGAMTIPKAHSITKSLKEFSFGGQVYFKANMGKYGSTSLHIAAPTTADSGDKTAVMANKRSVTSITSTGRDVRIHMH